MPATVIPLQQVAADAVGRDNVVLVRMLALCPMLAVSVSFSSAVALGLLTAIVMSISGFVVSSVRRTTPPGVRLPVFLLIVASLVAIADMAMEVAAPELHRRLGIFLPLVITNCAVLARLEVFAKQHRPAAAFLDGAASGAGMLAAIALLGAAREVLATGGIAPFFAGDAIVVSAALPAGGFILFGLMIAAARLLKLPTA